MLSVLLLLLLVSGTQAGFDGYLFTYTTKGFVGSSVTGISHATVSFDSCQEAESGYCGGTCFTMDESVGEWCQKERIWNWIDTMTLHQLDVTYGNWTPNLNGVSSWRYVLYIELKNRSDIGKPNSSPQTTIIPALRVPSNCQRNVTLLSFDPDGDMVKCRYADGSLSECNTCTPPSVLNLSSSCTLSFSPTDSSNEGPYAVQMIMEDFPRQNITLTDYNGVESLRTPSDFINKIPLQFVFKVDPAVPSCSEGLYLPRFLPPTPDNGAQINTTVNQLVEITVSAEATQSVITELLFSGPHNVVKSSSGSGNFSLSWTPSDPIFDVGLSHPICFVVQSNLSSSVYQSELRCVVVTVGYSPTTTPIPFLPTSTPPTTAALPTSTTPVTAALNVSTSVSLTVAALPTSTAPPPTLIPLNISISAPNSTPAPGPNFVVALNMKISTTLLISSDKDTILNLIKEALIGQGLSSAITVRLLSSMQVTSSG